MAKTTFINGDKAQGIPGTRVTAEFLNSLNRQRHDGLDEDGHGALDYAAATGSANAYAITLSPPLPALIPGLPITFLANHTNTGPSTLNVDGLGAVAIRNVNQNLVAGQIQGGQIVTVMYDGAHFQMVSAMRVQDGLLSVLSSVGSIPVRGSSGIEALAAAVGILKCAGPGEIPTWGKLSLGDTGIHVHCVESLSSSSSVTVTAGFRPSLILYIAKSHDSYNQWSLGAYGRAANINCCLHTKGSGEYDEHMSLTYCIKVPGSGTAYVSATSATGYTIKYNSAYLLTHMAIALP